MSVPPQTSPLLEIKDLQIGFWTRGRWVQAVEQSSISVNEGEGLAVIGESGSGKTLTMMACLALIPPNPGVIGGSIFYRSEGETISLLDGIKDAYRWDGHRCLENHHTEKWRLQYMHRAQYLAGLRIGIIFQNPIASLDPLFSIGATLMESIQLRNPSLSRSERYEEAVDWLDRVHIKNPQGVMRSYPHQLSGGMCQRVMIAATLAMRPRVIIADEPTTGLDMTTKAQILYLLHEARSQFGSSLIFVTHEIGLVTGLTERVVVMRKGHVVDEFATARLSEVHRVGKEIQAPADLANHTQDLLIASLKLEEDSSQEDKVEPVGDEMPKARDTKIRDESPLAEVKSHAGEAQHASNGSEHHRASDSATERKHIEIWQKQQTVTAWRSLLVGGVLAGAARLAGKLLLGLPLFCGLLALGLGLFAVNRGHSVLQTIHKHRLGQEHFFKARLVKWLGVVMVPVVIWALWF